MGSVNFYPVPGTIPPPDPKQESRTEEKIKITRLLNSIYYFIEHVYITKYYGSFRLIAKQQGRLLCDQLYPNLRGAKIAFAKRFNYKLWDENAKPHWSHFYTPDLQWYKIITPKTPPKQSPRGET